jgi:hypothetical protein
MSFLIIREQRWPHIRVLGKFHQGWGWGVAKQEGGRSGGKIEWKLSGFNIRAVSRGQNKLIGG